MGNKMNTKLFVPFTTLILLTGIFAVPELLTADEADEQRVAERQDEEARRDEINAKRKEIIRKVYQLKRELKELEEAGNEDAARRVAREIEEYTHVLEELAEARDHDGQDGKDGHDDDGEHREHEEHQRDVPEHREEDHREISGTERAERELHGLRQRYEDLIAAGKEDAARQIGQRIRRVEMYLEQQEREHNEQREHNDGNQIEREIIELKQKYDDLIADGQEEEARKVANHIEELVHHYREQQEEHRHAKNDHEHDERGHHEAFERRMHEMASKLEELHEVREKILRDGNEDALREIEAHIEDLANHMRQMEEEFHNAHQHEREHEREHKREHDGHPSREQIEHVVKAVEHLHAAGLHEYAEALERELNERIHKDHEHHGHDDHEHGDHHGRDNDRHHEHDNDNHHEHVEAMHDAIHDAHRRIDEIAEHLEKVSRHLDEVTEFVKELAERVK